MRDITLEETCYFMFTTRAFSSGVPTTLAGTPVLSVLESNNATPITAGVSVSVDRASVTGLNQATVVATAANGYEAGKSYAVYISTGTVGGVSVVGEVVAEFTVQAAAAFTRIGAAGAGLTAVPWNAAWDAEAQSEVNDGLVAFFTSSAALVDAVWDEVLSGAAHNVTNSAGKRLRQLGAASITGGTAQSGASNSITLAAGESATNEIYDSNLVVIVGGTGAGQSRVIVEYNGTTKTAIVDQAWVTNPDATSEYEILADHQSDISQHGLAQAGAATTITLSSTASATDDVYVGSTIYLSTSTGSGQARLITDYDGTTKVATVSPAWATNPGANTVYKILPIGRTIVDSGTVTTVNGLAANVITAASIAAAALNGKGDWNIGKTGYSLTAGTGLGNQTADITGTVSTVTTLTNLPAITANWLTAAGIATGAFTSTKFAAGAIDAASLATDAVDEIRDGVWAKVVTELTGDPGATPTALQATMLPYMAIRNKRDTDSGLGTDEIHNSAGTVILTATISDAAGIFSKAKYV